MISAKINLSKIGRFCIQKNHCFHRIKWASIFLVKLERNPSAVLAAPPEFSLVTDGQRPSPTPVIERAPTPIPVAEIHESDNDNDGHFANLFNTSVRFNNWSWSQWSCISGLYEGMTPLWFVSLSNARTHRRAHTDMILHPPPPT